MERRRRTGGWLSRQGERAWGREQVFRHVQYVGHIARMQFDRLTPQVCKLSERLRWLSLQQILPNGWFYKESHRWPGAKIRPWEENLEALGDRFVGATSVEDKEAWNLRWGCWPVSWWDVARARATRTSGAFS